MQFIIAASILAVASASYAPPAYEAPAAPAYESSSSVEAPTYETSSTEAAPVYSTEAPAPVYSTEAPAPVYSTEAPAPVYSTSAPVYHSAPVYSAPVYNTSATAPVYETTVVPTYTTYCPQPTHLTYGTKVWTVTEATTLTLTSVTVTKPIYSETSAVVTKPVETAPVYETKPVESSPVQPTSYAPVSPVYPTAGNNTMMQPSASATYSAPPQYTGAATKASFGFAGIVAAAALLI